MHVAITGASSGIGAALAREFAQAGADLTLVARRRPELAALARESPGRVHIVQKDLRDPETCCDWLGPAEEALGPLDVLVNNAGVQIVRRSATLDPVAGEELLRLDLLVPLRLSRAVLPGMLARGRGTLVDIASVAALAPTPGMWHYNAAKGGLAAASESLRGELRRSGVHVVTVYPGPVDTPLARAGYAAYPPSPAVRLLPEGRPEVLARLVRRAVERRRPRVIYPRLYALCRYFPTVTRWLLDLSTPAPLT